MSTIVQIQVNVDDAKALSALTNIDNICKSLGKEPVTIKIDAGAIGKVDGLADSVKTLQGALNQTKFSQSGISDETGKITKLSKEVKTYNDQLGRTVEVTKKVNKAGEASFTTKVTTDISKQTSFIAKQAQSLQDISAKSVNLDTGLANLSNNIKTAADSGKYAKDTFAGLAQEVAATKSKLSGLDADFKGGKISAEEYAKGVNGIATESAGLKNQFANLKGDMKETSALTKLLGDDFLKLAAKQAAWQLLGSAVAAVKNSFKEALATMKEVDSELATVRKVTGMTAEEMNALGDSAYSTASKYGVSANEYLQNVATFARAGYKEASEGLGELAIKTQLVGDTDQETAAQFLLSADAAWKYRGNVDKLSLALDEANTIDNNYATSIQKIAEGLPIVANVAAMAGMTMEETMAMLGTITATTQESGTKAATAARALILNILGDTTTEISDGVTATEESVNSLGQILKKYAPDVVAAAEATGELVNPMEAIAALAKAAEEGLLTEADLMKMVSALGGKLRTNQLLALLQNFDMYKSMLAEMSTAAGSANKEMGVMLDTWAAKTNILKNTWTEFISHLVDTSVIKGGLDVVTGLVRALDTEFGHFAITVAGVTAAVAGFGKAAKLLGLGPVISGIAEVIKGVTNLRTGFELLTQTMLASPLFYFAAGTAIIYGVVKVADALTTTYEEQVQVVDELSRKYDNLYGSGTEYDDLISRADKLTEAEKNRLIVLEAEKTALEDTVKLEKQSAADMFTKNWGKAITSSAVTKSKFGGILDYNTEGKKNVAILKDNVDWLSQSYQNGTISQADYRSGLVDLINTYKDTATTIRGFKDNNIELTDSMSEFLDQYDIAASLLAEFADTSETAADATSETSETLNEAASAASAAAAAVENYENKLKELKDYTADADKLTSAFETVREQYEQGLRNTPEILSFFDTAIPANVQRELGYSVEKMMQYAVDTGMEAVYSAGNPADAFFSLIEEKYQSGLLDGIVRMEDGAITGISSFRELADAVGWVEGPVEALLNAILAYNDGIAYTDEQSSAMLSDIAERLNQNEVAVDGSTVKVKQFVDALKEVSGAASEIELNQVFDALLKSPDLHVDEKAIEQIRNEISAAFGGTGDGGSGNVQTQAIQITVEGATEATQEVQGLNDKLTEVNEQSETKIKFSQSGASSTTRAAKKVSSAVNSTPSNKAITISVTDRASQKIKEITNLLRQLKGVIATLIFNGEVRPAANGTKNDPGGLVLVNDGKPVNGSSAELIVDRHGARIENGGEMALTTLEPGSTVYTAQETQRMLTGKVQEIPTFESGSWNRPSTGGTGSSGSYAYGGSSSDEDSEGKTLSDEVNKFLSNLDKQIKLAQNRNDKVLEQALQKEAATLVKTYVEKMLAAGLNSKDDAVLDLLNKGYGYSDSLMDELVDALENLTASTDAANSLAEKEQAVEKARQELENAKKQRTVRIYNPVTGQWEWVAKADDILEAQENLAEAEKDYQDAKIEKELDAIRKGSIGDIGDLTMSPALRELIASASDDEQKRIADILHAISGGAKDTTDTSGESIFKSTDSHDVYYQFGDLKLSEAEAKNMTVKELAEQLKTLKLT